MRYATVFSPLQASRRGTTALSFTDAVAAEFLQPSGDGTLCCDFNLTLTIACLHAAEDYLSDYEWLPRFRHV